jgi:2-polyprenyl-3-methyl-5-hydroxy-6-metoxy-1,4-benzoquinol methylase
MEPPWFEYLTGRNSEDLEFCKRIGDDHEVPVFCDLSTICGHYHWVPMGQAQFRTIFEGAGINLSNYSRIDAADMLATHEEIELDVAKEIFEKGNAHMTGDYFRAKHKDKELEDLSEKEIRDFYKDPYVGYLYIIELLHWNMSSSFDYLRKLVMPVREQEVLEIGSGIGTVSMQLAIQRNNVVSSEINERLRSFHKMRWDNLAPKLTRKIGDLHIIADQWRTESHDEQFDTIIAFDVFEHLHEVELKDIVKDIYRVMKRGGRLVYHANFAQQNLYPTHYDHSEWWSDFLDELGFHQVANMEALKL